MKKKKKKYVTRFLMMPLTVILIVLFFAIMSMVTRIQGTARAVNYAGLVRGKTQRIIKLENAGEPQDIMIGEVESYIQGLRYGSDELQLVRLEDSAFQDKMEELDIYFTKLKSEIMLVRERGYENTDIIQKSEEFFGICNEATGLAEVYSQKIASSLNKLEEVVMVDIAGLVILLGLELVKAIRYAAQNKILQKKVYLDEATGLPNKNKCEEILSDDSVLMPGRQVAVCVFDLNNLRSINNNLGHDMGDAYIRSFAVQLRRAVPEQHFVGRDGGDEFLAVFHESSHQEIEESLQHIRDCMNVYSAEHPEMPISYAAGYALSGDFEGCTMRELFQHADKNMYIDKNHAKIQEAADKQKVNRQMLELTKAQGCYFSDCIYCDALMDEYRVLRAEADFFLAEDGSYSGAVEQMVRNLSVEDTRKELWDHLQIESLNSNLSKENGKIELLYKCGKKNQTRHGRITLLYVNSTSDGRLHHFILGIEAFRDSDKNAGDEKMQLTRYYEQMKQSIVENGNYVDALMETAQSVYLVNLTDDTLEQIFYHVEEQEFDVTVQLPCSYDEYCNGRKKYVSEETLENFRIVDSSAKLLERFQNGEKQVTVEYQEMGLNGKLIWLQKMVLMSRDTLYDSKTEKKRAVVHGIILFKNTSGFHEKEQQEKERLQAAYQNANLENKAKTEFMSRMSHDIRTPINGIMGMLEIIRRNRGNQEKEEECLQKIQLSTNHLLALVNDVLEINKIESGQMQLIKEPFDLNKIMDEAAALVEAQALKTGIAHHKHRKNIQHTKLVGSSLQLRQIFVNLLSNAIKYNKPGGTVDTYAWEVAVDGNKVWYEFKIVDTGIGMSRTFVENELYKPFTQEQQDARTSYRGTGLGMSIVNALVQQMDGTIRVESRLGEGTTFIISLPFEIDSTEENFATQNGHNIAENLQGMHILLVEDNEINMEIAEVYLTDAKAVVEKAWNGLEAVEKCQKSEHYDAILMDVMMPVMDGLEATRRIRTLSGNANRNIAILAMTAQGFSESESECRDAGMDGYIAKPIESDKMINMILQTVRRKSEEYEIK